jgi:hypothetical protein
MIRFFVVFINPKITRNNTPCIPKEPGIQEALNYGVIIFGERTKRFLNRGVEIVNPLVKNLNIDKLVEPGRSLALRPFA